jgi:hypothetical protein
MLFCVIKLTEIATHKLTAGFAVIAKHNLTATNVIGV